MASCSVNNKSHDLPRRTTSNQQKQTLSFTRPRWILKCTNCYKLSHWQIVHTPHSLQAQYDVHDLRQPIPNFAFAKSITDQAQKVHSKSAYPVTYRKASLIRHRTSQPTPQRKAQRHTWLFQPLLSIVYQVPGVEILFCLYYRQPHFRSIKPY